jgi:alpha-2-macroglobulin
MVEPDTSPRPPVDRGGQSWRGATWVGAVLATAVMILLGWRWWNVPQGEAGATTAGDPNAPFAVLECSARMLDDRPALAVVLSQPVDRKQALDDVLRVVELGALADPKPAADATGTVVRGSWVVEENPRLLVFPYISVQKRFRIEVLAGLRSQDGAALAAGSSCDVASEALPPSFQFASRGVVLPAGQSGGLPIITTNVPEVDVQFLKVQPAEVTRFLERVAGSARAAPPEAEHDESGDAGGYGYGSNTRFKGAVGGWQLDELRRSTKSVYLGRFTTTDQPNKRQVSFLPVETIRELREPGVYIAVMSQPGRFAMDYQVTYFYVSDIGLHARRHAKGLSAFATSLKSGEAMEGVRLELLDEHARPLGRTQSDRDGIARFADVPDDARVLLARRVDGQGTAGNEMTVLVLREPGLDLSEFDISGYPSRNLKLFAYAGRDLYRPGEQFELSVLARNPDGEPVLAVPLTATLKRPDGRTVNTATWRPDEKRAGYFQRTVALPADAPTGTWVMELRADPAAKRPDTAWKFQVEEFLPERMKLDLAGPGAVLGPRDAFKVQVRGDYLYGAPAAGNRLLLSSTIERDRFALPKELPGFLFGDFADDARKKRQELPEQALDEQGRAEVTLPSDLAGAKSPMRVRGSFSLLESGGRPVVRSIDRGVWPAAAMLAVRPLFDRDVAGENSLAEFDLVRVDAQGQPVAAKAPANVRLVQENRDYYWRFDDQRGWNSGFTETEQLRQTLTVQAGTRVKFNVPVQWGRYRLEVDDPETGLTLRYRFFAGWGAQDAEEMGNRPDRVQVHLGGAPYKAGDVARITVRPPHDGTAIVTVEGDRLLWSQRVAVKATGTEIEVPIPAKDSKEEADWARHDLYLGVVAFRPGSQGERVTPARAVGLAHLPLARDDRKLKVVIGTPDKLQPEKRATVKIKVEGLAGQAGLVTLSAVDVGILNITRYATPSPGDFFFGKHRYGSEQLDNYGRLIEKLDGTQAKLRFGGDANVRDTRSLPRKVRLVDVFSGPVALDSKGEAEIGLDLPDFNGSLRLMAVVSAPRRFGSAEQPVVVAAPVVAELAMPRFISPGDAATVSLDVTNLSGSPQTLKIKLDGADPVRVRDNERSLTLTNQQRSTLRFPVEATDAYGLGRLQLSVEGEGVKLRREAFLQVQPPIPTEREVHRVKLDPGATFKIDPAWTERYFKASTTVALSLGNTPPLNVNRLVKGLLDYPYGCLEQTTSAAYPHVFIDDAGAKAVGLPPRSHEERTRRVDEAISRIAGLQKQAGGFSLWGDGPYEAWLTSYVLGFLSDARAQGFSVPEPMVKRAQEWLLHQVQQAPNRFAAFPASAKPDANGVVEEREQVIVRDAHQRFAELAYAGYMLARDQKAPLASLRYLHDQVRDRALSPLPLVHLALALKQMGDEPRAQVALDDAMKRAYGFRTTRTNNAWGTEWLGDYGSAVRDGAMAYALLVRHGVTHPRRENLLFETADRLGGRQYLSTQERLALFLAARAQGASLTKEWSAALKTGDDTQAFAARATEQRTLDAAAVARGVSLTNRGTEALFVEVETAGFPTKPPAPRSEVIDLKREWFHADGSPWRGEPLKVGDALIVRLSARARQRVEDGLVVDRVPAGLEIENQNLSQGLGAGQFVVGGVNVAAAMADARIKHREFRDDRFVAAVRLDAQPLSLFYFVRVVSPGRFGVPGTYAEDMYRPELRSVGQPGKEITITDPRGSGNAVVSVDVPAAPEAAASAASAPEAAASAPPGAEAASAAPAASAASR